MRSRQLLTPGISLLILFGASLGALGQGPGTWAIRAPMPSARTEVAAVEASGFVDTLLIHGGRGC